MNIDPEALKEKLSEHVVGHNLYYVKETGSTNDDAYRLGAQGAPEGTVVIAESQHAGKGRMRRIWHSPPTANIYTSILLRPPFETSRAPQISIAAGVAAAEAINPYCAGRADLKWPNDVLIGGKKVCGILAQMKASNSGIDFVVVGIGINVNLPAERFPDDLRGMATSLSMEAEQEISRPEVIIRLYENLAKWYMTLCHCGFEPVRRAWLGMSSMIGRPARVLFHEETISGTAVGLHDDGALVLRTDSGQTLCVSAGDATILKE